MFIMRFVLFLLCVGATVASDVDIYNLLVDETLDLAAKFMVKYHFDTLPIPQFTVTYNHQPLASWKDVDGTITGGSGTVINATGVHRNGDANIQLVEDKMIINVNVFTDPMVATFQDFKMNIKSPFPFSSDGGMQMKIGRNEVSLQITIEKAVGVCKLSLDKAELTTLGTIDFLILPDSWWAEVKDKELDVYVGAHTKDLVTVVNMYLPEIMKSVIAEFDPCPYIPF